MSDDFASVSHPRLTSLRRQGRQRPTLHSLARARSWIARAAILATVPLVLVVIPSGVAHAQDRRQPLADVLSYLLTHQSVQPAGDIIKDAEAARVTGETITRALLVELATLPIGNASPGFVYRLNPELGTVERASESFGPFFAERSLTAGRGQASFGVSFRTVSFTHLDGEDLRDGGFITSGNRFSGEASPFDVETLTLDLSARTVTGYANVGVTDRLDLGVAVPLVSVSLGGSRVTTSRGRVLEQARADARATGLGDIAVRTKYLLYDSPGTGGLAAVGELRLPTGGADDLLGAGEASFRALIAGSLEPGRFGVHANGGFIVGGVSNEVEYRTAASVGIVPRLTAVAELLGRRIEALGRITATEAPHPRYRGVESIRLESVGDSLHTASGLAGIKWNVTGSWLLSGTVSRTLIDHGLGSGAVVQIGLDYAWTR